MIIACSLHLIKKSRRIIFCTVVLASGEFVSEVLSTEMIEIGTRSTNHIEALILPEYEATKHKQSKISLNRKAVGYNLINGVGAYPIVLSIYHFLSMRATIGALILLIVTSAGELNLIIDCRMHFHFC